MEGPGRRIVIVGGVAGGASCAARARRLSEDARIVVLERGPFASFANCGLPYHIGDVIRDEGKLLVADAALFRDRFRVDVRLENEATAIDPGRRVVAVRDLRSGREYEEPYDALVLAAGAAPIRPPLPGINAPGIFSLRTIPDTRRIRAWIDERRARSAVIVGGGFIGLEMAENLVHRGLSVNLVEGLNQVLAPLDPEMVAPVHARLREKGVALHLGEMVAGFEPRPDGPIRVSTKSGLTVEGDLVILSIGVRPETALAKAAGLEIGQRGGVRVDDRMRTSDPRIWAVGDMVEVRDIVTGEWTLIPLAGPANRQGRVAADAILGRDSTFRGVQGTSVVGLFGLTIACTGANEKTLKRLGRPLQAAYLHPGHHAGYYPDARPIHLKLLYDPVNGRILGAQAVGEEGVDKRIDVIAMAIQKGGTVFDLEEAELCYAPQYGAAKDPVNMAGMIAANAVRGDAPMARWDEPSPPGAILLDVRDPSEFAAGHAPGAINIPLNDLRDRLDELPADRPILAYCRVGQRGHNATRLLRQHGRDARNLTGGYLTHEFARDAGLLPPPD
jgi:NADPH-dependent 2,4-dienoyl-CoA reductase/sulfur reductase-like enzyme/rhodanese-related sulfurtransferase